MARSLAEAASNDLRYDDGYASFTGDQLRSWLREKHHATLMDPHAGTIEFVDGSVGKLRKTLHVATLGTQDFDSQDHRSFEERSRSVDRLDVVKQATKDQVRLPDGRVAWIDKAAK